MIINTKLYMGYTTILQLIRLKIQQIKYGNCEFSYKMKLCGKIKFKFGQNAFVSLKRGVVITGGAFINCLGCLRGSCIQVDNGATLHIGEYTSMSNVSVRVREKVIIGNHVTIGAETIINDSNSHCIDYMERRQERQMSKDWQKLHIIRGPIIIEDDVFIGARCIIGKGVRIGARSVVAAGSVVVKNIPSDEIWGGNPCKFIKKLETNSEAIQNV